MFWGISFCVGNKTIEVNGQEFSLGVLTAECLNISLAGSIQKKLAALLADCVLSFI